MEYRTVKKAASAEFEDRRSRFIGNVIPAADEETATAFIERIRRENFGARHNVYAYILRDGNTVRYSDDGEPHSTAGVPTLDVLRKNGLCDCCIVTTRYFGGVLLGTGGLVHAYTEAAVLAVESAGIIVMRECYNCRTVCGYTDLARMQTVLENAGAHITGINYTDEAEVLFSVVKEKYGGLSAALSDGFCGRMGSEIINVGFTEA